METKFVLASRSPRRRELLARMGVADFLVEEADIDERSLSRDCSGPRETVLCLAEAKAGDVSARHPDCVVIGSDTIVCIDGEILGKPANHAAAHAMLRRLSGREHQVLSGISVCCGGRVLTECEETVVRFRPLSDREIDAYIEKAPPFDKAGAYGIQDLAALFVEGIVGDYYNVMGFPVFRLGRMLASLGIEIL